MSAILLCLLTDAQAVAVDLPPGSTAFIKAFDLDYADGIGMAELTTELDDAYQWPDVMEALETWRTPSRLRPRRPDGGVNRPLTAYTVEIVKL